MINITPDNNEIRDYTVISGQNTYSFTGKLVSATSTMDDALKKLSRLGETASYSELFIYENHTVTPFRGYIALKHRYSAKTEKTRTYYYSAPTLDALKEELVSDSPYNKLQKFITLALELAQTGEDK